MSYDVYINDFNPPSPCGEGRGAAAATEEGGDFNPPSPCGEGREVQRRPQRRAAISIHPPHAGRDGPPRGPKGPVNNFNPPSPCGEGHVLGLKTARIARFQSTLPMRGGTLHQGYIFHSSRNFNPPSPCGEGRCTRFPAADFPRISIHPPHAGRDENPAPSGKTPPHFNPPSPCGEGLYPMDGIHFDEIFQSTLPMRGGTSKVMLVLLDPNISIHPPHAGRDVLGRWRLRSAGHFNPPSPCGEGQITS